MNFRAETRRKVGFAVAGLTADFSRIGGALPTGISAKGRSWRAGASNNRATETQMITSIAHCA